MCRLRDPITSPAARLPRSGSQRRRGTSRHAAGNLTREGGYATHSYDGAGRRTASTDSGVAWSYAYNALGQRLKKSSATSVRLYAYDARGHLLGEYDATGKLVQETVWLGDTPVATLRLALRGGWACTLTGRLNIVANLVAGCMTELTAPMVQCRISP
jgi:YD repeat-containing protein